jgi:hypothetical protein
MTTSARIKIAITWLFLISAVVACAITASFIPSIAHSFGSAFPATSAREPPAFTSLFLSFLPSLPVTIYIAAGAFLLGVALVQFRGVTPESKAHAISLATLLMYHLLLFLWMGFVIAFVWLQNLNAAI